ncbi:Protein of unknown function [Saccharopolyspora antimicrobica]|uniref:Uncharacterized protein DUF4255 n=1 Tax=Saccharopolyspora antimicrobica TaxID=455193 RepID=A0A1I4U3E3_9PSEU|nr:DUF4255 domain-containing protein [Saccharopolyspora antimicrobica]RKT88666.1 uncharacterized protein DUF4255 [Saccharopolyspora antimicrobica]SFM83532.1 Protein of unknown function [Saccharopolyspora antimicrobica]
MIHEVDEALRRLLAAHDLPGAGVELGFEAPTTDWAAKRNAPTISVFLYDIREEPGLRQSGRFEQHDESGAVTGWQGAPHWFQLSYLVTAWTKRPQDEHRLLSAVLRCVVGHDALEAAWLTGTLAELGLTVAFEAGGTMAEGRSASDVWSALGGQLKPSINLQVTAPLAGERIPAGPPVTEGVVLQADADAPRRLRYDGPSTAEGEGFAPARRRPEPKRRRRGPLP